MKFFAKRLPALLLLAALTVSAAQPAAALQLPSLQWPSFGKEEEVAVESIDPGSYNAEMTLGTTQQLKPTVLPDNATDKEVVFASEDISIIQVGQDGLIGAASVGTTRVSATAGGVTIYYTITVTPDPSTVVSDMDAAISEEEIAVGATATISVSVSPSSAASTANVTFSSSNESVATVNNFGRVTGVGKGSATITITCGDIVRTVSVKVYVPTDGIHLNTNYLVLKPGATAQISGSVSPSTAPQSLTFRSSDTSVATVSSSGTVTAVGAGSTSIIVSNGDSSSMVTVIVNQGTNHSTSGSGSSSGSADGSDSETADQDPIVQQINDPQIEVVNLNQGDIPTVTTQMLDALRRTGKTMNITGEGYILTIRGTDIRNTQNALATAVTFTPSQEEDGLEFSLNEGGAMPCAVSLTLTGDNAGYGRLYLYNTATQQWQFLNSYADSVVTTDTAGRYLLTNNTLTFVHMNFYALAAAGVALLAIVVVYIVVKKRYWFW